MSIIHPIRSPLVAATALLSLASGCAQTSAVQYGDAYSAVPAYGSIAERPLSIGEIGRLIQEDRPSPEIVAEIEQRGLLAPATEADLDLLLRLGASQEIIDIVQAASQQPPPAVADGPPATVHAPPAAVYVPPITVVPDYAYPWGWAPPFGFGLWYEHVHRPRPPAWRPPPPRPRPPPGVGPHPGPGAGPRPPGFGPRPPDAGPQPPRFKPPSAGGVGNGPPPGLGGPRRGPDLGGNNGPRPAPGVLPPRPAPGLGAPRPLPNPGRAPGTGFRPSVTKPAAPAGAPPGSGGFRPSFRAPERR